MSCATVQIFDIMGKGYVMNLDASSFLNTCESSPGLTMFHLITKSKDESRPIGEAYQLSGCVSQGRQLTCPLGACALCGGTMHKWNTVSATMYDLIGPQEVEHIVMRCNRKLCRAYHYYNYVQVPKENHKVNILTFDQADFFFVSAHTGFSKAFLQYHEALHFRGFVSMRAVEWCQKNALWEEDGMERWRRSYSEARLLFNVMQELTIMFAHAPVDLDKHSKMIRIDDPLDGFLENYSMWWHENVLSKKQKKTITVLSMDGHEKIATKCGDTPPSRGGRPRKSGQIRPFNNGWFMITSPETGYIVGIHEMLEPENNAIAFKCLSEILPLYPRVDGMIYDRACSILAQASKKKFLQQVKYWSVDKFHGRTHVASCKCNPHHIMRLKRRFRDVNTSISEQTFSWFRGYSGTFNSMSIGSHRFYVHVYARKHNDLIAANDMEHLNPFSTAKEKVKATKGLKRPSSHAYSCSKKVIKRPSKK